MKFPPGVETLISQGYKDSLARQKIPYDGPYNRQRLMHRKWRNLCGEARFDIPRELWEYVDWTMPLYWHEHDKLFRIKSHEFVIRIPGMLPLAVKYRELQNGNDWYFLAYEITTATGELSTKKQEEFYVFLYLAFELKQPHRRPVQIEEINFKKLTDGTTQKSMQRSYEEEYYQMYGGCYG